MIRPIFVCLATCGCLVVIAAIAAGAMLEIESGRGGRLLLVVFVLDTLLLMLIACRLIAPRARATHSRDARPDPPGAGAGRSVLRQ